MKLPCALIRDLLPLYHDGVCAPESGDAVEEHLRDCGDCREAYHALQDAAGTEPPAREEPPRVTALQRVKKKIRMRYAALVLCGLMVLGIPVTAAAVWLNVDTVDMPTDMLRWVTYFENVPPDAEGSLVFVHDDESGQELHPEHGAFKAVFSSHNAAYCAYGLNYNVLPYMVDGRQEWVMFLSCRVSKWDAMWDSTQQSPPVQNPMGIWINSDWDFWDASCQRFVDEGLAQEPADEDKGCFISRVYFLPDYDVFKNNLGLSPEEQERVLREEAVLMWEKGAE